MDGVAHTKQLLNLLCIVYFGLKMVTTKLDKLIIDF